MGNKVEMKRLENEENENRRKHEEYVLRQNNEEKERQRQHEYRLKQIQMEERKLKLIERENEIRIKEKKLKNLNFNCLSMAVKDNKFQLKGYVGQYDEDNNIYNCRKLDYEGNVNNMIIQGIMNEFSNIRERKILPQEPYYSYNNNYERRKLPQRSYYSQFEGNYK